MDTNNIVESWSLDANTKLEFELGQTFEDPYPPEAAEWCTQRGDCTIVEIESITKTIIIEDVKLVPKTIQKEVQVVKKVDEEQTIVVEIPTTMKYTDDDGIEHETADIKYEESKIIVPVDRLVTETVEETIQERVKVPEERQITVRQWQIQKVLPPSTEQLFVMLRTNRDIQLQRTDYLITPDYPIDSETRELLLAYRQKLRDLPDVAGAPWDGGGNQTPWPVMPKITRKGE